MRVHASRNTASSMPTLKSLDPEACFPRHQSATGTLTVSAKSEPATAVDPTGGGVYGARSTRAFDAATSGSGCPTSPRT